MNIAQQMLERAIQAQQQVWPTMANLIYQDIFSLIQETSDKGETEIRYSISDTGFRSMVIERLRSEGFRVYTYSLNMYRIIWSSLA